MIPFFHGFSPSIPDRQIHTESQVNKIIKASRCGCLVYLGWPANIWNKSNDEIVEFLLERFETTLFIEEYHLCMLYLGKYVEKEYLYVPFSESPQHMKILETYQDIGKQKKTRLKGFKQGLTSSNKTRQARSFKV